MPEDTADEPEGTSETADNAAEPADAPEAGTAAAPDASAESANAGDAASDGAADKADAAGDVAAADVAAGDVAAADDTANRRQLIRLAVQRRPEITLDGLLRALTALEVTTDRETVVADLDSLDIRVLHEASGDEVLAGPGLARLVTETQQPAAGASDASAHNRQFWAESARHGGDGDSGGAGGDRLAGLRSRRAALIGGVAALVVLVVVAVVLANRGSSNDNNTATPTTTVTATVPTTLPGKGAAKKKHGKVTVVPLGPGGDLHLLEHNDAYDQFTTNVSKGLGKLGTVGVWRVVAGQWSVSKGMAWVRSTAASPKTKTKANPAAGNPMVLAPVSEPNVRVQVSLPHFVANAGLVFRATDDKNFWLLAPEPKFGTFVVIHVVNGKRTIVTNTGLTTTKKHAASVGVYANGSSIEILVNGAILKTITDTTAHPAGGFGLGVLNGESLATFDSFLYDTQ